MKTQDTVVAVLRPGEPALVPVKSGARYRITRQEADGADRSTQQTRKKRLQLTDEATQERLADGVLATRDGDDLQLRYTDGNQLVLEDFYRVCADGACSVELPWVGDVAFLVDGDSHIGQGRVVHAHGPSDAIGNLLQELHASAADLSAMTNTDGVTHFSATGNGSQWGWSTLLGPIGGGFLMPAAEAAISTVRGTIVGGPVIDGHQLRVEIFKADGTTKLGEALVDASGRFSLEAGDYIGVVVARVVDGGEQADYLDEATEAGKDLNAALSAVGVITASNTTLTLNINALTTIAHAKALQALGGSVLSVASVNESNAALANAFGVSDLHATSVVTTNGTTSFDSSDGLSAGEAYGAVLAALSGADARSGGNTQTTIDALVAGLNITNGSAVLTDLAQAILLEGARRTDPALVNPVARLVDTIEPSITSENSASAIDENSGAGQLVYTVLASDETNLTYSFKADNSDHAAAFTINASTGEVTLTGDPDHETQASYSFTVVATDASGNASEQAVTLAINALDEEAPTITSGGTATAIDENSGAGQVVYTASSTDTGDVATGSTSYSLKADNSDDAALFSIDSKSGEVTLTGDPDHETKASYSFTVVATDAAGNASEQAVTLAINALDEVAPTITSLATATAIDENSGAGPVVYTASSTDTGDVATAPNDAVNATTPTPLLVRWGLVASPLLLFDTQAQPVFNNQTAKPMSCQPVLPPPTLNPMTARILLVDDQADIRKLIRLTLQHLDDAEVHETDNGGDGWRMAQDLKPDLMLLDVMMPGELDGYQVCAKVKSDPVLAGQTKVILLTARAQKEDEERGHKAGADAYITKAFSPLKLLDLVDNMLGRME